MNLTPKQLHLLCRIRDIRIARGYSPTMQEMADELGVSKVTVFERVEALIKKGALLRDALKARSLTVNPDIQLPNEVTPARLPLVGTIAAGSPIEAVEDDQQLDLETMFMPPRSSSSGKRFALKVRGESMIEAQICDGDYVICEQKESARNGQTVVALLDTGEATLKKYYREKNGTIRLQPANRDFEPRYVNSQQLAIQGVVIGVVRNY